MSVGKASVLHNNQLAGTLEKTSSGEYIFRYDHSWFNDPTKRAISLTLPKTQQEYRSQYLFPFFANHLSEGANKAVQREYFHFDENDDFAHLLLTAHTDTIGAVTVKAIRLSYYDSFGLQEITL